MMHRIKQLGLPLIAAGSIALLSFAPAAAQGTYPYGGSTAGYGMPPAPYMMQHSQAVPQYGYGRPAPGSRYGAGMTSYGGGYARLYRVVYGDTLFRIAARFGVSVRALLAANPSIRNPNLIYAGQRLVIPSSRGAAYSSAGRYAAPGYAAPANPSGAYQAPGASSGGYSAPAAPQAPPAAGNAAPAPTGQTAQIALVAQNMAFNQSTLTVPAGAHVIVQFNNMDAMPHSFAVYTDSSARQVIFKGQILMGPATTTYQFDAPSQPGTYFFRCDVHPTVMTGQFVVTSGS